ncbi:hypothetical protein DPM19_32040 [Actinomadura craniellae]|uniref:DUF1232 domain-containing protein n=1 Tax=Actinomadura craniellae TaxID=2231787 RepID=A0A365GWD4_9ACTN|nr:DUF1232 domain-containing protein [Actinomadura craniellae]RAY11137.1 hypothetical protein DPM19_32040 [Actinomadura craniellae]
MVWCGIAVLIAGAILAFTADGELAGADLSVLGLVTMALGAALTVAGLVLRRLARRRRAARADGGYRTGTGKIAAMVAAAVYILSPLDIVPDVFLPVGVVDDATALAWLVFAFGQEAARRHRAARPTPYAAERSPQGR